VGPLVKRSPRRVSALMIWLMVVLVALYLPLGAMIFMSFNKSRFGLLPFEFSLQWYEGLGPSNPLVVAAMTSLELAFYVALTCIGLGVPLAMWLTSPRMRVPKLLANANLLGTIAVPLLILSVGILAVVRLSGLGQSSVSLWLACTVISLPYMVFVVTARLQSLDPRLVAASRSLGAGPFESFLRVTLPLTLSSVFAGTLMAFVICFNNFTIQVFIAPLGVQTLPVNIYAQTRVGVSPDINAVASIIVVAMIGFVALLQVITGSAVNVIAGARKEPSDG
jgi:ABC-type spermidine/putrescine transport system permease subunit II